MSGVGDEGERRSSRLIFTQTAGAKLRKAGGGKKNLTIERVFSQIIPETIIDPSDVVEQGADTSLTEIELQT